MCKGIRQSDLKFSEHVKLDMYICQMIDLANCDDVTIEIKIVVLKNDNFNYG